MDKGGWPGLNEGKNMIAGLRFSLQNVVKITIKFARDSNETSSYQRTFSSTYKFFGMIAFSPWYISHILY